MSCENAPSLTVITASQQGGTRGAQLWGAEDNGTLHTIFQETPGGGWGSREFCRDARPTSRSR